MFNNENNQTHCVLLVTETYINNITEMQDVFNMVKTKNNYKGVYHGET